MIPVFYCKPHVLLLLLPMLFLANFSVIPWQVITVRLVLIPPEDAFS